jgi:hypothetical protein
MLLFWIIIYVSLGACVVGSVKVVKDIRKHFMEIKELSRKGVTLGMMVEILEEINYRSNEIVDNDLRLLKDIKINKAKQPQEQ